MTKEHEFQQARMALTFEMNRTTIRRPSDVARIRKLLDRVEDTLLAHLEECHNETIETPTHGKTAAA